MIRFAKFRLTNALVVLTVFTMLGHFVSSAWAQAIYTDTVTGAVNYERVYQWGSRSGVQNVDAGGTANNTTISAFGTDPPRMTTPGFMGGTQNINSGGAATNTTINANGVQNIYSGGTSTTTSINGNAGSGYGYQYIYDGGIATGTTIYGGFQYIYDGGSAVNTTVNSGGAQIIDGGTATSTTILAGGILSVDTGYVGNLSGSNIIYDGGILSADTLNLNAGSSLTLERNDNETQATVFTGEGSLIKTGSGILTLIGDNTYTGGTTISSGTLQLGTGIAGQDSSLNSDVINNATLIYNLAGNQTAAYAISGSGSLTKTGSGILALLGTNTYSGDTIVNAGTLSVTGSLLSTGNVFVSPTAGTTATLSGAGSVGSVTVDVGGILASGTAAAEGGSLSGTLTAANLTLLTGSTLQYYLGSPGQALNPIYVSDSLVISGSTTVSLMSGANALGTYQLIQYTTGNLANNDYSGLAVDSASKAAGYTYSFTTESNGSLSWIDLVIAQAAPGSFYWKGGLSNSWADLNSGTSNWTANRTDPAADPGAVPGSQDDVYFSATGINGTLATTLDSNFSINSLHFLTPLSGTMDAVTIAAGTGGSLTIGSGGIEVQPNAGAITIAAPVILGGNQTWLVDNMASLAVNGAISGDYGLTKDGTGVLTLNGLCSWTGPANVNAGILTINGQLDGPTALSVNEGGKLSANAGFTAAGAAALTSISVEPGATIDLRNLASGATPTPLYVSTLYLNGTGTAAVLGLDVGSSINCSGTADVSGTVQIELGNVGLVAGTSTYVLLSATGGLSDGTYTLDKTTIPTGYNVNRSTLLVSDTEVVLSLATNPTGLYWTGLTNNNWNGGTNWTTDSAGNSAANRSPTATDDLYFNAENVASHQTFSSGTVTANLNANSYTVRSLNFLAGNSAVTATNVKAGGAGVLTITPNSSGPNGLRGVWVENGAGKASLPALVLGASQIWQVGNVGFSTDPNTSLTASGIVSGSYGLTKTGSGTLFFTSANTFTGALTIAEGTLAVSNQNQISTAGARILGSDGYNATLEWAVTSGTNLTQPLEIAGGAGQRIIQVDSSIGIANFTLSGNLSDYLVGNQAPAQLTVKGVPFNDTASANSVFILSGDNSAFTGGYNLVTGLIRVSNTSGLALGTTGSITFSGGTLGFSANEQTDYSARFDTSPGQQYSFDLSSQNVTFASNLSSENSSLTLTKSATGGIGTGVLTLSGNNSDFATGINLRGETLSLGSANAIGPSNTTGGAISFDGGTLQFTTANTQDYSVRFSPADNQQYSLDTNGQNVTLADNLSSNGGTLTKLGDGTLTLAANNTYNGATNVNQGTLVVAGNLPNTSSVTVGTSGGNTASLLFSGNNTIGGAVSVLSGATLGGAGSSPSTLTIQGATTVAGTMSFNLYGNGVSDQLVVNDANSLVLNNATLNLSDLSATGSTGTYELVNYGTTDGTWTDANTFTNITGTSAYTLADIDYHYYDQNTGCYYIALVPEPSTWVMLLTASLMGGIGYRRQRQKAKAATTQEG